MAQWIRSPIRVRARRFDPHLEQSVQSDEMGLVEVDPSEDERGQEDWNDAHESEVDNCLQ